MGVINCRNFQRCQKLTKSSRSALMTFGHNTIQMAMELLTRMRPRNSLRRHSLRWTRTTISLIKTSTHASQSSTRTAMARLTKMKWHYSSKKLQVCESQISSSIKGCNGHGLDVHEDAACKWKL